MTILSQAEYKNDFDINKESSEKAEKALHYALDIRKFEIGLYWQRAAYFWTLIGASFAGYIAILSAMHLDNKPLMAFMLSCIGFVFTFAWFQVNRGSKYWQENWENHVDMLEDSVIGPLYKTVLHRPATKSILENCITGPMAISASKTNQIVSLFTLILWIVLAFYSIYISYQSVLYYIGEGAVGLITVIFFLLLLFGNKTHQGSYRHVAEKRKTEII